jgi:hypothetical protein
MHRATRNNWFSARKKPSRPLYHLSSKCFGESAGNSANNRVFVRLAECEKGRKGKKKTLSGCQRVSGFPLAHSRCLLFWQAPKGRPRYSRSDAGVRQLGDRSPSLFQRHRAREKRVSACRPLCSFGQGKPTPPTPNGTQCRRPVMFPLLTRSLHLRLAD